jgi:hypothetical protein
MRRIGFIAALFFASCAGDLDPGRPDAGGDPSSGPFDHETNADGTTTTVVEATSETAWLYLDLETKNEVMPAAPESSRDWDLGFNRFRIKTNGGIGGSGGMKVAILPNADFAALTKAPSRGYVTDQLDGEDMDTDPDFAFLQKHAASETGWFTYDALNHKLTAAPVVYVVKTVEGAYFKVQMLGYYSKDGTAGYPAFRWGPVEAPEGGGTLRVEAGTAWTYVSVARGVVPVGDPASSMDWDLSMRAAGIQTNSGTDRMGLGGARLAPEGMSFDQITSAATFGYAVDRAIPFPGAPGAGTFVGNPVLSDWFIYDAANHTATSKGLVYLVRTATGGYAKMQIVGFESATSVYQLELEPIARRVSVEQAMIDASDASTFVYFDFDKGTEVEVQDPSSDRSWDLGLSRLHLQTNSGASGPGMGGAALASSASLDSISTARGAQVTTDSVLPDTDGGDYTGNAALASWYQFSTTTGTTAKDAAYLVRTGEGGWVKLKIRGYEAGRYTIDWAFAGAGREDF